MDGIGLGSAIATLIYLILTAIGIAGLILFLIKKTFLGALIWISLACNIFSILFLMGKYAHYYKNTYFLINRIWPAINLLLIIFLIINSIKNKNAKAK